MTSLRVIAVLLAASIAVPLATWRLSFLRAAPLRVWASHPWLTAVAFGLATPMLVVALASQRRSALMAVVLLTALGVAVLVIAVSIVHGFRRAWKRSPRPTALATVALTVTGALTVGISARAVGAFWWATAAPIGFVAWCLLMATAAELLERRYPE